MWGPPSTAALARQALSVVRTTAVVVVSGFMALIGFVTPFVRDDQLTDHPGFVIAFWVTVAAGGWIGLGARPVGRWMGARVADSEFVTRFLSTPVGILGFHGPMGPFMRLIAWPMAVGFAIGLAYGRTLSP